MKRFGKLVLACVLTLGLAACGSDDDKGDKTKKVTIGVIGENNEYWQPAIDSLKKDGIDVELKSFSDYPQVNEALEHGDIDLNSFQHYAYFNSEVESRDYHLSVVGDTLIAPLGIYSSKYKKISDIKDGDTIVIPMDPTNGGRALKILEQAGLLTIDPKKGWTPTVQDITENKKELKIVEVEAAQTATQMDDPTVGAAIINGAHAVDHGLNPSKDSIYLEKVIEGEENPYINILVCRTKDKDNKTYKKVLKAFQSEETKKVMEETYKGAFLPAWK